MGDLAFRGELNLNNPRQLSPLAAISLPSKEWNLLNSCCDLAKGDSGVGIECSSRSLKPVDCSETRLVLLKVFFFPFDSLAPDLTILEDTL